MSIDRLVVDDFRNLREVELRLGSRINLFVGPNGAGKTALLEAAFALGRTRSFRSVAPVDLIRNGAASFLVRGRVRSESGAPRELQVTRSRNGEVVCQVDGVLVHRISSLTELLPTRVVTGTVGELVEGAPANRRAWLDWLLFHVEPGFPDLYRRLQLALRQRGAALQGLGRGGGSSAALDPWDLELAQTGTLVAEARERWLVPSSKAVQSVLQEVGLSIQIELGLAQGWAAGSSLIDQLIARRARDVGSGHSSVGPHRADVVIRTTDGLGRKELSRGQAKLIAMAMILGGFDVYRSSRALGGALLLDEIASDLDQSNLRAVLNAVERRSLQVMATAVDIPRSGIFKESANVVTFHVERGHVVPE
ncbi:MAG: DNA replication/repair protein RecF [Pseudomonadales bacterium]